MTDEEKEAWNGVTEEAAQYLVDTVTQAAGNTLLRGALRKLAGIETYSDKYRTSLVYQALMAASDAGYVCGVRPFVSGPDVITLHAVIELPTGAVGFPIDAHIGLMYIYYGAKASDPIREFLDIEGRDDGGTTQARSEQSGN